MLDHRYYAGVSGPVPVREIKPRKLPVLPPGMLKVSVYHETRECVCECCGHTVLLAGVLTRFDYVHPDIPKNATPGWSKAWATGYAKEIIEREWPDLVGRVDWDGIEFELVDH